MYVSLKIVTERLLFRFLFLDISNIPSMFRVLDGCVYTGIGVGASMVSAFGNSVCYNCLCFDPTKASIKSQALLLHLNSVLLL